MKGATAPNTFLLAAMEDDSNDTALARLFKNSIADTPKGRSLKRFILSSWKKQWQGGGEPTVASVFIRQVLGNPYLEPSAATTTAVGYGGSTVDGAWRPEVFYIMPLEMRTLSPGADRPSRRYRHATDGLARLALPAFGVTTRNVWPMLMFVRAPDKRLLAYAMTQEMHTICERLWKTEMTSMHH